MYTTLRKIREHRPCPERYRKLYKSLGGVKTYGEDTIITLEQIIDYNGLDDALWALRACNGSNVEKFVRLLACDYAERVLYIFEEEYPYDVRPRRAIEVSRKYAVGKATAKELQEAYFDARFAMYTVEEENASKRNAAEDAALAASIAADLFTLNMVFSDPIVEDVAKVARYAVSLYAGKNAEERGKIKEIEKEWQEYHLRETLKTFNEE